MHFVTLSLLLSGCCFMLRSSPEFTAFELFRNVRLDTFVRVVMKEYVKSKSTGTTRRVESAV